MRTGLFQIDVLFLKINRPSVRSGELQIRDEARPKILARSVLQSEADLHIAVLLNGDVQVSVRRKGDAFVFVPLEELRVVSPGFVNRLYGVTRRRQSLV